MKGGEGWWCGVIQATGEVLRVDPHQRMSPETPWQEANPMHTGLKIKIRRGLRLKFGRGRLMKGFKGYKKCIFEYALYESSSSAVPCVCTVPKIRFMHFQRWNCAASFPIPTFMYLWAIYLFPGLVFLFSCSKICRRILGIYKSFTNTWMWKWGDKTLNFFFNNKAVQFYFWEYINRNQTFILDSHRPFICSLWVNGWSRARSRTGTLRKF